MTDPLCIPNRKISEFLIQHDPKLTDIIRSLRRMLLEVANSLCLEVKEYMMPHSFKGASYNPIFYESIQGTSIRINLNLEDDCVEIMLFGRTGLVDKFRHKYPNLRCVDSNKIRLMPSEGIPKELILDIFGEALQFYKSNTLKVVPYMTQFNWKVKQPIVLPSTRYQEIDTELNVPRQVTIWTDGNRTRCSVEAVNNSDFEHKPWASCIEAPASDIDDVGEYESETLQQIVQEISLVEFEIEFEKPAKGFPS